MVRKSLVAVLILLYSASTIGMPLHFHYCKGELRHVSLLVKISCHDAEESQEVHACCKTNQAAATCHVSPSMKSCCDDATQWVQDKLPAILAKDLEVELSPAISAVAIEVSVLFVTTAAQQEVNTEEDPPPGPPIYLRDCSLIYYG